MNALDHNSPADCRIPERIGLDGTSGAHLTPCSNLCSSRPMCRQLPRIVSSWVLSIPKDAAPPPMQVLPFLHHLHEHLLHLLLWAHICLVLRSLWLPASLQVWPCQVRVGWKDHLPRPAATYRSSPKAVCFLCHEGMLLPHGQLSVLQDPRGFFAGVAFHVFGPSLCWKLVPHAIQRLPQQVY